ncbi:transposase family protein [Dictyobacter vulcani]|uniref:transposase family protein n=1 Tax=Dictyobacter vulcani TaxID=2607529 RepID=UPI0012505D49|nr:transposase family protein [Dictyobacter vulcani]
MEYSTLKTESKTIQEVSPSHLRSLYDICAQILISGQPEGSNMRWRTWLIVLILAKLAGMKSLLGASDWARDQGERLREQLNVKWKRMPCANTYKYALARLESQQINERFRDWLLRQEAESRCGDEPVVSRCRQSSALFMWPLMAKCCGNRSAELWRRKAQQACVCIVYEVQTGNCLASVSNCRQADGIILKPLLPEVLCKGRHFFTRRCCCKLSSRLDAW